MDRSKLEMYITAGIGALLILLIVGTVLKKSPVKSAPSQTTVLNPNEIINDAKVNFLHLSEFQSSWGMDPFRGKPMSKTLQPNTLRWNLSGILWSPDSAAAIVNDQIIHEGDQIRGFTVKKILKDKVIIEKKDKILELFVKGD